VLVQDGGAAGAGEGADVQFRAGGEAGGEGVAEGDRVQGAPRPARRIRTETLAQPGDALLEGADDLRPRLPGRKPRLASTRAVAVAEDAVRRVGAAPRRRADEVRRKAGRRHAPRPRQPERLEDRGADPVHLEAVV